jgi:hypothetical protein
MMSQNIADDINSTHVSEETMIRVQDAANARGEAVREVGEKPDLMDAFFAIKDEFGDELSHRQIVAIMFRMMALATLVKERSIGKWAIPVSGQEYVLVQEAVFRAAARAKLHSVGNSLAFDPSEFVTIALAVAEEEGNA